MCTYENLMLAVMLKKMYLIQKKNLICHDY